MGSPFSTGQKSPPQSNLDRQLLAKLDDIYSKVDYIA